MTASVSLERATPERDRLLRDLLELYVEELSAIFPVTRGPDGRFGYEKLAFYWAEPDERYAFLIKAGPDVAGFALVTRGSPASETATDLDVAEFFVLRAYRRSGIGREAAIALWNHVPGRWVVRVAEHNVPALRFWTEVIASYSSGAFVERVQHGDPQNWRILTFGTAQT
jgi:predicted acetyltransferase